MTNILIIDDDPDFRAWLTRILEKKRHHIDVARDGQEAFRCLERKRYELLMVDLLMPVVSGFEVLDSLGRQGMKIPTIIMSGIVVPEVHQYLKTHENIRLLSKPFSEEQLQEAIESLLGGAPPTKRRRKK
jgi:CheY-like chemotaxis protein